MLKSPYLFAISVLVALIQWTGVAKAEDLTMGLSFELPPAHAQAAIPAAPPVIPQRSAIAAAPTAVELTAIAESDDIALTFAANTVSLETIPTAQKPEPAAAIAPSETNETVAFNLADSALSLDDWIFESGTHSLVAHTVGSAEGTRHADGRRTQAYYGHTDPGNGVWNLGTFSYQHEADSPEDADEKQLQRLKRQGIELETQAVQLGITLSLDEKLNGLDLANQAPLAALDTGGYIDRLAQAKRLHMEGDEAILWARTHAYIDPNTRRWNAPGLGNNIHSISKDQERRMSAIASALKAYSPIGLSVASLTNLGQVSLTNGQVSLTSSDLDTSPALIDRANENSPPLFRNTDRDINADLEISFGLPSATPETTTNGVITASAETFTNESAPLSIADIQEATEHDAPLSNMGITFSPTEDLANPVLVANLPVNEMDATEQHSSADGSPTDSSPTNSSELMDSSPANSNIENEKQEEPTTEATDLFSISRSDGGTENAQQETENAQRHSTLPAAIDDRLSTSPDALANGATANSATANSATANGATANGATANSATANSATANGVATDETAVDETTVDKVNRLESLLTGVSTVLEPDALANLKNKGPRQAPATSRPFFRTEDKIVPEK